MKLVQLILRKIIKIVTTRCHILRLKCTKFDFGCGSAPDPAGGAYSAPQTPLYLRGLLLREGKGGLSGNVAEEAFCLKSAPEPELVNLTDLHCTVSSGTLNSTI